jgi:DNA-directed RNA polymerase subunit RPC12/RpoP
MPLLARDILYKGVHFMTVITLICEGCGGNVELDDKREFGFCIFCGTKMLIKSETIINEITQNITKHVYGHEGKDVDELVTDGNRLLELGDNKKANVKFKQAVTVDPKCWEAWFGYATTGGENSGYLSCVPAYRNAYNAATEDAQELATFTDMMGFLPDRSLGTALINTYKAAPPKRKHEIFELVLGVIGCDESEIANLVIDLCPNDWRALLAQAKIRQIRVKWCEMEVSFFKKQLPAHAIEVLNIFLRTYQLAKKESEEAKNVVLSHITAMTNDNSYATFARELNAQIRQIG